MEYFHHVVFAICLALDQIDPAEIATTNVPHTSVHMMLHYCPTLTIIYINIIILHHGHPYMARI